jgi:glucosamine--fructose-6-phosphate aminotransferase (isomerizing)
MTNSSQLLSEIYEQPAAIRGMLEAEAERVTQISQKLSSCRFSYALLAARGTSYNAARYGQYIFGAINHLSVALAAPSLFTRYHTPPRLEGALVIGISQSGQSPDIVSVIEEARRQGAPTIAITNDLESPLALSAEYNISLGWVSSAAWRHQDLYRQLTVLALPPQPDRDAHPGRAPASRPGSARDGIGSEPQAKEAAKSLAASDHTVFIGRGFNYSTAYEIALKCKELAYMQAEPYSSADFLHGPIATVDEGFPVSLVSIGVTFREEFNALARTLHERTPADNDWRWPLKVTARRDVFVPVPSELPEWLSPIAAIARHTAHHLARSADSTRRTT